MLQVKVYHSLHVRPNPITSFITSTDVAMGFSLPSCSAFFFFNLFTVFFLNANSVFVCLVRSIFSNIGLVVCKDIAFHGT